MFDVTSCQLNLKSYIKWVTYHKSKLWKLTENAETTLKETEMIVKH